MSYCFHLSPPVIMSLPKFYLFRVFFAMQIAANQPLVQTPSWGIAHLSFMRPRFRLWLIVSEISQPVSIGT